METEATTSKPLRIHIERLAGFSCAIWLQVVGIATGTILHHIIQIIPIVVLLVLPRSRWIHFTSSLTAFIWIFMLAGITPMVRDFYLKDYWLSWAGWQAYSLATVMCLLCAIWMTLNLVILRGSSRCFIGFLLGGVVLVVVFALVQPELERFYMIPLERILARQFYWFAVILMQLVLTLALPWRLAIRLTHAKGLQLSRRVFFWQAIYWASFPAFIVGGIMVDRLG